MNFNGGNFYWCKCLWPKYIRLKIRISKNKVKLSDGAKNWSFFIEWETNKLSNYICWRDGKRVGARVSVLLGEWKKRETKRLYAYWRKSVSVNVGEGVCEWERERERERESGVRHHRGNHPKGTYFSFQAGLKQRNIRHIQSISLRRKKFWLKRFLNAKLDDIFWKDISNQARKWIFSFCRRSLHSQLLLVHS